MNIKLFLYHRLASFIPESRCYPLKAIFLSGAGMNICRTARISSSAKFVGAFDLAIGDDTFVGHEVLFAGGRCSISIGANCDLWPRACVVSGSHEIDMVGKHTAGKGYSKDIIIEDGVWIGANVTVLGGVTIGSKSVIGAGSTVIEDVPANVIALGTPCRVIKVWRSDAQQWDSV